MTSRERVQAALEHRQPDMVPIDVGGCDSSTLTGIAYNKLRRHLMTTKRGEAALNGGGGPPRIWDIVQQVALIDEEIRRALGGDTVGVHPEPLRWREASLPDGSPCLVPAEFQPTTLADGSQAVLAPTTQRPLPHSPIETPGGGPGEILLLRKPGGLYFEPTCFAPYGEATCAADFDRHPEYIEDSDWSSWWDLPLAELAARTAQLRVSTDYFIAGNVYDHILATGQWLRGFEQFMIDLMINKSLAHGLMERLVDTYLRRFENYLPVAQHCDIIVVNDDLGTQDGPQMSPQLYREMIKPHHQRLWSGLKQMCGKPLLLHSCGSVYALIPDLIEMGIDALNPVQVSAADMDSAGLKREFGKDITFWGGGCDTQFVLPRGTVQEVTDEVRRRVEDLAEDGGFVFCPVHNVQPDVPVENIVACYAAARE
jgi:uroporphyrinogen decarboxylase